MKLKQDNKQKMKNSEFLSLSPTPVDLTFRSHGNFLGLGL